MKSAFLAIGLVATLAACTNTVSPPGFVSGPWGRVEGGVVTIAWETEAPSSGAVELGTESGSYHRYEYRAGTGLQTHHEVALIGLEPGAHYVWRVRGVTVDRDVIVSDEGTVVGPAIQPEAALLTVTMIDISQYSPGDALLVRSPEGRTVLLDGGGDDAIYKVRDLVRSRGVQGVDVAVVSHDHWDHAAGLARGLLADLEVRTFVIPENNVRELFIDEIRGVAAQLNIEEAHAARGQKTGDADWLDWGEGVEVQVVSAGVGTLLRTGHESTDINNDSIVLHVRYGDATFLFTGDAEDEANDTFVLDDTDDIDVDVDVLKVNHHGRTDALSYRYVEALTPQVALVSTQNHGLLQQDTIHLLSAVEADVFRIDLPSPEANRADPDQQGGRSTLDLHTDGHTILVEYDPS